MQHLLRLGASPSPPPAPSGQDLPSPLHLLAGLDKDSYMSRFIVNDEEIASMGRRMMEIGGHHLAFKTSQDRTPFSIAACTGKAGLLGVMLEGDVIIADKDVLDALICAVSKGHTNVVSKLLGRMGYRNPLINEAHETLGRPALHAAAIKNRLDIAKLLVEMGGADVSTRDREGRTAVEQAGRKGATEVARYLSELIKWQINSQGGEDMEID
jgi:ankyrin repeat protein